MKQKRIDGRGTNRLNARKIHRKMHVEHLRRNVRDLNFRNIHTIEESQTIFGHCRIKPYIISITIFWQAHNLENNGLKLYSCL